MTALARTGTHASPMPGGRRRQGCDYGPRVGKWERRTAIPMLALAVLSLAILLTEFLVDVDADGAMTGLGTALAYADMAIMVLFAVEFGYLISLVPHGSRVRYMLANPIDVLVVLVVGAQPLRLLRSARALRAFRAVRVTTVFAKGSRQWTQAVTRLVGAWRDDRDHRDRRGRVCVLVLRRLGDPPFRGPRDAFWWSAATITTLGRDVEFTGAGSRVVAVALTVVGLIVVAALAGTLTAFFVESDEASEEATAAK
jgi:hypothetical protein